MKISQSLPQFHNKRTLLAVTGRREARFYLASDGNVTPLAFLKIQNPSYSDREELYSRRGNGKTYGTGSVLEPQKQKLIKDFIKAFRDMSKRLMAEQKASGVGIFTPEYMAKQITKALPPQLKEKISFLLKGNYTNSHPLELLENLKSALSGPAPAPHIRSAYKARLEAKIHKAGRIASGSGK